MNGIGGLRAVTGGLALALALWTPGSVQAQSGGYLDFGDFTSELRDVVDASDVARMSSLGTSHEGREVWMVEIARQGGVPTEQRPGVLVVGNLSGDHLVGSALALETVRHLVANASDELLDGQVVYVIPRLNPDGAEAMFQGVLDGRTRNARPYDDDNDGRTDEDPAEDLNGDGVITVMRVADPLGAFIVDPDEPRLMKRADATAGEAGTHTLYIEGTDSDGDGFYNEDGTGGVDLDRNFQHAYPYWERDAGPHMVSEPETRALMDFVIAHRNIGAVLTFGHSDNLVTPPDARGQMGSAATLALNDYAAASLDEIFQTGVFRPQQSFSFFFRGNQLRGAQPGRDNDPDSGRRPATTVNGQDREYFTKVSEAYKEITGIEELGVLREPEGAFFQYGYFQFGVPSFTTPGWGMPEAAEEESEAEGGGEERAGPPMAGRGGGASGTDARVLGAMEGAGIDAFVEWAPYSHPELGSVEIGGFRPYAVANPPADQLGELGASHGEFVERLASMLPRVRIADTEVTAHGGGVFTVSVEVVNEGFFPTTLQHGIVSRSVDPTTVQIQVPPERVLTGDAKTHTIRQLEGSGHRARVSWVVQGRQGESVEITVRAQKGGSDATTVTLR